MKLWAFFACIPLVYGSVIVTPTPVISESCTIGNQPIQCGYNDSRIARATTRTDSAITGFGTGQIFLNLDAYAEAGTFDFSGARTAASSVVSIALNFTASTDGPQRQGLATFFLHTDSDHGSTAGALSTINIDGLGGCQFPECSNQGVLVPFALGASFEVALFALANGGSGVHSIDGGWGEASVQLQLFEIDGRTPVAIYDPVAVPEPSAASMVLLVLVALVSAGVKKSSAFYRYPG